MQDMAVGTSPGPNGLTIEWFKAFFHIYADDVITIYNSIFENHNQEPETMKKGYKRRALSYLMFSQYLTKIWRSADLANTSRYTKRQLPVKIELLSIFY